MKWICFVDGSLLLLLLLIGCVCLLKGRRLITIWLLLELRIGLKASLIAVLLWICGCRLLALAVWIGFIIRICVEISIGKRRLYIVSRTAAGPHHSLGIVLRVVSLVGVKVRRVLLSVNWVISELIVFVGIGLLSFVRLAQPRVFCWIRHPKVLAFWRSRRVRFRANHVSTVQNNN